MVFIKAKQSFWVANSAGWGLFGFINIFFQTKFFSQNLEAVNYSILLIIFGFITSLFIRHLIIVFNLLDKKLSLALLLSILITLALSVLSVTVFFITLPLISSNIELTPILFIGNLFNLSLLYIIWTLIYVSYLMFNKQQSLALDKLNLQLELKEAELTMLRNQLSPHFLFNALNNIRSLILIDQEKSRDALLHVSDLLRYALTYQKKELVTIEEEMEIVKAYIELNKLHLGDKVSFELSIDNNTSGYKIPPMSIQLLVENAIKHGEIKDSAIIKLLISKNVNSINIEVSNPGKLSLTRNQGIGVRNLKDRLNFAFGDNAHFLLSSKNNNVTANITLPC